MDAHTHVFGYGSLVNRLTHPHAAAPARVKGWRRTWRGTARRQLAFLSAEPDPAAEIEGLVAAVAPGAWPALDAREAGYARISLAPEQVGADGVAIYAIPAEPVARDLAEHPILLSYLDVVVQGFLAEFGPGGAARFFETTSVWQAPVLDDRARPIYPRAQRLTAEARETVDGALARLRVTPVGGAG